GGIHRWTARHNEQGKQVEKLYFGADGKPINYKAGPAKTTWTYREGRLLERAAYKLDPKGGYVLWSRADENNHSLEKVSLKDDGVPFNDKDGVARTTWVLGDGKVVEKAVYKVDPQGKFLLWRRTDSKGRLLESASWTKAVTPTVNEKSGSHRYVQTFDEKGNQTSFASFGLKGEPTLT